MTQTEAPVQAEASTQAESTAQAESEIRTEATTAGCPLARNMRLALGHIHRAVNPEDFPKETWGRLGWTYVRATHYAFHEAVAWGIKVNNGTNAPIRTGASLLPSHTLEDVPDYEKCHYVTRAEEVGDVPARPVPWDLPDWQEHMERIVENPGDNQERGAF